MFRGGGQGGAGSGDVQVAMGGSKALGGDAEDGFESVTVAIRREAHDSEKQAVFAEDPNTFMDELYQLDGQEEEDYHEWDDEYDGELLSTSATGERNWLRMRPPTHGRLSMMKGTMLTYPIWKEYPVRLFGGDTLVCYKNDSLRRKFTVDLRGCTLTAGAFGGMRYAIELRLPEGKGKAKYYLAAGSESERDAWVKSLTKGTRMRAVFGDVSNTRDMVDAQALAVLSPGKGGQRPVFGGPANCSKMRLDAHWFRRLNAAVRVRNVRGSQFIAKAVAEFTREAQAAVTAIVDELVLPEQQRTCKAYWAAGPGGTKRWFYVRRGVLIRLAGAGMNLPCGVDVSASEGADEDPYLKLALERAEMKSIAHELQAAAAVTTLSQSAREFHGIRAPLCCRIDYRGFRALCTGASPIEVGVMLGTNMDGARDAPTRSAFKAVGLALGVLHAHKYEPDTEAPTAQAFAKKGADGRHHVVNCGGIMPFELPADSASNPGQLAHVDHSKRVRFELLRDLSLTAPSGQTLLFYADKDGDKSTRDVARELKRETQAVSEHLRRAGVDKLLHRLDRMELCPYDSEGLTRVIHGLGINARLMGRIAERTRLPHIRDLLVAEMCARAFKHMFRDALRKLSRDHLEASSERQRILSPTQPAKTDGIRAHATAKLAVDSFKREVLDEYAAEVLLTATDLLNLILGKGEESTAFRQGRLTDDVEALFEFRSSDPDAVHRPQLLSAVLYHCGVTLHPEALAAGLDFESANPVHPDQVAGLTPRVAHSFGNCWEPPYMLPFSCASHAQLHHYSSDDADETAARRADPLSTGALMALSNLQGADQVAKLCAYQEHLYGGPESVQHVRTLVYYASVLAGEDPARGVAVAERALSLCPVGHPRRAEAHAVLMRLHHALNDVESCQQHYAQASRILRHCFGEHHPMLLELRAQLVDLHERAGNHMTALDVLKPCPGLATKVFGWHHPTTAFFYRWLGRAFWRLQLWTAAIPAFKEELRIWERMQKMGDSSAPPHLVECNHALSRCLLAHGSGAAAMDYARAVCQLLQSSGLPDYNMEAVYAYLRAAADTAYRQAVPEDSILYLERCVRLLQDASDREASGGGMSRTMAGSGRRPPLTPPPAAPSHQHQPTPTPLKVRGTPPPTQDKGARGSGFALRVALEDVLVRVVNIKLHTRATEPQIRNLMYKVMSGLGSNSDVQRNLPDDRRKKLFDKMATAHRQGRLAGAVSLATAAMDAPSAASPRVSSSVASPRVRPPAGSPRMTEGVMSPATSDPLMRGVYGPAAYIDKVLDEALTIQHDRDREAEALVLMQEMMDLIGLLPLQDLHDLTRHVEKARGGGAIGF